MANPLNRAATHPIELLRADLTNPEDQGIVLELIRDYFAWMNLQVQQAMGCSISDLVGMELEAYITSVMESVCRSVPPESAF